MSLQFEFVRWGEGKKYAVFRDKTTGKEFYVPRSRLIPTLPCEIKYRREGLTNREILEKCSEESSVFGIALARHFAHLFSKYKRFDVREPEKEYDISDVKFSKVRDLILKGKGTDEAIWEARERDPPQEGEIARDIKEATREELEGEGIIV